jgi:Right handed beta helix region
MEVSVNRFRSLVLALTFVTLAAGFSSASDIYIAQNAGSANTGADCADAHAASWFNSSSNWGSGGGQIGPGTTVHLCGTFTGSLTAGGSGSSGSPITIRFETGAKISVTSCGNSGCLNIGARSYMVVDGGANGLIEATGNGTGLGSASSYGVYARTCANNEVKNMTIANMYVHSGASDNGGGNSYGIWTQGTKCLFHDNTIHDGVAGIVEETSSSGNQFYNNTIYHCNWGIFLSAGASANAITNEKIYGNEIHDFANWDTTGDTFHHDGIFLSGNNATNNLTNTLVYNNYIHGTSSSPTTCAPAPGNGSCMTAYIYINTDSYVTVFNNLLVANPGDPGPNNGWILMYVDDHDALYNNTIIGGGPNGPSSCVVLNSGANFNFKDNILSNCPTLLWNAGSTFVASGLDFNTYQNSSLDGAWRSGGNYYSSLTSWRSASNGDTKAQATTGSLGLDSTYVPQSGSIVINAAADLSGMAITPLNSDKAGIARPSGTILWDAGSYQQAGNNILPPTGLTAQVR